MNIKEFIKNHKKEIVLTSLAIGGAVIVIALTRKNAKTFIDAVKGNGQSPTMTKEQVIEFLKGIKDADNFAIFKETAEDVFQIVTL